jgi:hypothetical protein
MTGSGPAYLPATDMPRFLRELAEFVGLGEADVAALLLGYSPPPRR